MNAEEGERATSEEAGLAEAVSFGRRRFAMVLVAILVVAGLGRAYLYTAYLRENPRADHPIVDSETYWLWAGRIAEGDITLDTPFFSAPLYPYLLGIVRAAGGGLHTVFVLQILTDLLTAAMLARYGRRIFDPAVGLAAAAIFLLLMEPASFSLRILACSLHLLLVTLAWGRWHLTREAPSWPRIIGLGVVLGCLSLAWPPAMLMMPVVGPSFLSPKRRTSKAVALGSVCLVVVVLVISPATACNWRASGEFHPIQALSGVTMRIGNQPGAEGVYRAIPGISKGREQMLVDAAHRYEQDTGNPPSWSATDRYYRNQAIAFWKEDLGRAMRLAGRKAYWFLTGREYGDIYRPYSEVRVGLFPNLDRVAPLPTSWVVIPGVIGTVALIFRRKWQWVPGLSLAVLPFLVVVVFWYSPRYRLPALPILVVAVAWLAVRTARWPAFRLSAVALTIGVLIAIGLQFANKSVRFDPPSMRDAALALIEKGEYDRAERLLESEGGEGSSAEMAALAYGKQLSGDLAGAAELYRKAVAADPQEAILRVGYGAVLVEMGLYDEAIRELDRVLAQSPDYFEALINIGQAYCGKRRFDLAESALSEAVRIRPRDPRAWHSLGVMYAQQGRYHAAIDKFRKALEIDPTHASSRRDLVRAEKLQASQGR